VGINRLTNGLKMIAPGGHVRVPELFGQARVRALTSADQANRATAHIRPFGTSLCQSFNGNVPVAVSMTFFVEPDSEENKGGNGEIRVQVDQNSANIRFGKIRQANITVKKSAELGPSQLAGTLCAVHKEHCRVDISSLGGISHHPSPCFGKPI